MNLLRPKLVGDDLVLYNRQNDYGNVLLQKLITTQASISILDNTKNSLNASNDLKRYHELSDITSIQSVLLLDELDQLRPKHFLSLGDF